MDLKGIPYFMMNQVLKRHPLALRYIRYQLTDTTHTDSDVSGSDEELAPSGINDSSYQSSVEESSGQRYRDSLPIRHFLRRVSTAQHK